MRYKMWPMGCDVSGRCYLQTYNVLLKIYLLVLSEVVKNSEKDMMRVGASDAIVVEEDQGLERHWFLSMYQRMSYGEFP